MGLDGERISNIYREGLQVPPPRVPHPKCRQQHWHPGGTRREHSTSSATLGTGFSRAPRFWLVTRGIALTARRPLHLPMGVSVGNTPGALPVHTGVGLCWARHFSSPWLSVATRRHGNLGWQARLGLNAAAGGRGQTALCSVPAAALPAAPSSALGLGGVFLTCLYLM